MLRSSPPRNDPRSRRAIAIVAVLLLLAGAWAGTASSSMSYQVLEPEREPIIIGGAAQPGSSASYSASAEYGRPEATLRVFPASESAFDQLFAAYDLYVVYDPAWWSWMPHVMAYHPAQNRSFDMTREYAALMAESGSTVLTSAAARMHAYAYIAAANIEIIGPRMLVNSTHSAVLNRTIADPAVTMQGAGWNVTATTWSPVNGVITTWYVRFSVTSIVDSGMTVDSVGAGPSESDPSAPWLKTGDRVRNQYAYGHTQIARNGETLRAFRAHPLTFVEAARATAFDGTAWVAYLPLNSDQTPAAIDPAIPQVIVDAGASLYGRMVERNLDPCAGGMVNPTASWGFEVASQACEISVFLFADVMTTTGPLDVSPCSACVTAQNPQLACRGGITLETDQPNSYGPGTQAEWLESLVAHEFFHVLQCETLLASASEPLFPVLRPAWKSVIEGQARFVETLVNPSLEHRASSRYYGSQTSVNAMATDPWDAMCLRGYSYALLWTYAAVNAGGGPMEQRAPLLLRRYLEEIASEVGSIDLPVTFEGSNDPLGACAASMERAMGRTLAAQGSPHPTHADLVAAMAADMLTRTRFTWAEPNGLTLNWAEATLLEGVAYETAAGMGTFLPGQGDIDAPEIVGSYGTHYLRLDELALRADEPVAVRCDAEDAGWHLRLVHVEAVGVPATVDPCPPDPVPLDLRDGRETYVVAVRADATAGAHSVTLTGA